MADAYGFNAQQIARLSRMLNAFENGELRLSPSERRQSWDFPQMVDVTFVRNGSGIPAATSTGMSSSLCTVQSLTTDGGVTATTEMITVYNPYSEIAGDGDALLCVARHKKTGFMVPIAADCNPAST